MLSPEGRCSLAMGIDAQAESFERIKQALASPAALARYEPRRYTIVAADASGYGIGAVLMQATIVP